MSWRIIVFVAIFAIFLVFVVFNLENKCEISFGFGVLKDVPIFITIFASFVLGLFSGIPLAQHFKKRKEIMKDDGPPPPPDGKMNAA